MIILNFNGGQQTPTHMPPFNSTSMGIGSMPALNRNDFDQAPVMFELMSGNLPSMLNNNQIKQENRDRDFDLVISYIIKLLYKNVFNIV